MDQTRHQNLTAVSLLKIVITKLLLSVCVLSFLFSSCSPCLSLLFDSFNYSRFSATLPLQDLFTHTIDRKCMFLICNGILVFLVMVSSNSAVSDEGNYELLKREYGLQSGLATVHGINVSSLEEEEGVAENQGSHMDNNIDCVSETKGLKAEDGEGGGTDEDSGCEFFIEEEEEEEEGGRIGILSAEELNRKFDEFIIRMKEGIRTEAQQQLVMVR